MINDESQVDAIDTWRANAHPDVLAWLESGLKASRRFKEPADKVAAQEALLELARVLGQ